MNAVVVALGKIGLPIAAQLTNTGHSVIGCDIDADVVATVNAGRAPFPNEAGLEEALASAVAAGRLKATTNTATAVATGPELVIAVPPLVVDHEGRPDWSALDAVVADIGRGLRVAAEHGRRGITVALETTVPVGTTRSRVAAGLVAASGLTPGVDFHVVFSPERVFSGRVFQDLATYPKLVGGLDAAGERRGVELYGAFLPEVEIRAMGGAEAAELTKLAETTYRDINIAFANELARHADALGVDVQRVIDAANSQPFSHIHRPGVAVGGHCIPVYPRFYLAGDPDAQLPAAARHVNEAMPAYAVGVLQEMLGGLEGKRVLILGVAYRGGVKETAFSGAMPLRDNLRARGAIPVASDPLYDAEELRGLGFEAWDGMPVHGAIVQADHAEYRRLGPTDLPGVKAVIDGRGVLNAGPFTAARTPIRQLGKGAAA